MLDPQTSLPCGSLSTHLHTQIHMFMSTRVYDKRKSYKVGSTRRDERMWGERGMECGKCHRGQKTLAATEARKSQGNSNKSATTFAFNTVATFFMRAQATDPNSFLSPFWPCPAANPDYPKLSLSRTSLCLSLDRHTITYAGNIRQGNKSANSCHEKKRANIQSSFFLFYFFCWN